LPIHEYRYEGKRIFLEEETKREGKRESRRRGKLPIYLVDTTNGIQTCAIAANFERVIISQFGDQMMVMNENFRCGDVFIKYQ